MSNLASNFFWQKNDSRRYPVTLRTLEMSRFADLIMPSKTPPKCGATGGLKCQSTP